MSNGLDDLVETLTEKEAPHLHAAVEELCQKAGIAKPKLVVPSRATLENPVMGPILHHTYAALDHTDPKIMIGKGFSQIMGQPHLSGPVNDEIKAVLAHEIGHIKHMDIHPTKVLTMRLSPLIGLAGGIGGMALYDHIKKNQSPHLTYEQQQKDAEQQLQTHISTAREQHPYLQPLIKIAQYTAAASLGLIAGSFACKVFHNAMESRADKYSATLMGSGEPLANALTKFKNHIEANTPKGSKPPILFQYIEWMLYPPIDKRIETLRRL